MTSAICPRCRVEIDMVLSHCLDGACPLRTTRPQDGLLMPTMDKLARDKMHQDPSPLRKIKER